MLKIAFQNVSRIVLAFSTSVIEELSCFISWAHLGMTWVLPDLILDFPSKQVPSSSKHCLSEAFFKKIKVYLNNNKNNNKKLEVMAISPVLGSIKAGQGGRWAIQVCPCLEQPPQCQLPTRHRGRAHSKASKPVCVHPQGKRGEFLLSGMRAGVTNVTMDGQRMVAPPSVFPPLAAECSSSPSQKWGQGWVSPHLLENLVVLTTVPLFLNPLEKYQYFTTSGLRRLNFNVSLFPPMHLKEKKNK